MNTLSKTNNQTTSLDTLPSNNQTRQLMQLGRAEQWRVSLLGIAPLPEKPVRLKDWLLVPAHLDDSAIPERALKRVQAIFQSGIRPKGFVLVHEAPMQLPAPELPKDEFIEGEFRELEQGKIEFDWGEVSRSGLTIATRVLMATVSATVAVGAVVLPAIFTAGVALLDPILVAVTDEDVWVEIDRWWV